MHSLRHSNFLNSDRLSENVWRAKGEEPEIRWKLLHKMKKPDGPKEICKTCNLKRIEIAAADEK